jgi:AcrR family transcriptional regulator
MANDRKNQIIRAAAKRFTKHGLNKTTLDEIARDIRIGKASIYHYFLSKDDLFYETLKWEIEIFLDNVKTIFNNESINYKDRLTEYFNLKEGIQTNYKLIYDLLVEVLSDRNTDQEPAILKHLLDKEEELLKKLLSAALREKMMKVSPQIPSYVLDLSWGMVLGNKIWAAVNPEKTTHQKELIIKTLESIIS